MNNEDNQSSRRSESVKGLLDNPSIFPEQPRLVWSEGKIIYISSRLSYHLGFSNEIELCQDEQCDIENLLISPSRTNLEQMINESENKLINFSALKKYPDDSENKLFVKGNKDELTTITIQEVRILGADDKNTLADKLRKKLSFDTKSMPKNVIPEHYINYIQSAIQCIESDGKDIFLAVAEVEQKGIFQLAIEEAPNGFFVSTIEGRFLYCNKYVAKMYGREKEDLYAITDLAKTIYVEAEDRDRLIRILKRDGVAKDFFFNAKILENINNESKEVNKWVIKDCSIHKFNAVPVAFFGYIRLATSADKTDLFELLKNNFSSQITDDKHNKYKTDLVEAILIAKESMNKKYGKEIQYLSLVEARRIWKVVCSLFGKPDYDISNNNSLENSESSLKDSLKRVIEVELRSVKYIRNLLVGSYSKQVVANMLDIDAKDIDAMLGRNELLGIRHNFDTYFPCQQFIYRYGCHDIVVGLVDILKALDYMGIGNLGKISWLSSINISASNRTPWELLLDGKIDEVLKLVSRIEN